MKTWPLSGTGALEDTDWVRVCKRNVIRGKKRKKYWTKLLKKITKDSATLLYIG